MSDTTEYSIDWNRALWNTYAEIPENGEGWSEPFGDSEAQWHCIIRPRLRACLPARRVLEIACGWGRWTNFLIHETQHYTGVDITEVALQECGLRYFFDIKRGKAAFHQNDGKNLGFTASNSVDFVFSFDSLVHANMDAISGYLTECARILSSGGKAFIHHSNAHGLSAGAVEYGRSPFVSAALVRDQALSLGLNVISQEKLCWRESHIFTDCFTVVGKNTNYETLYFDNPTFNEETQRAKQLYSLYKERL